MIMNVKEINPWLYRYEHLTTGKYRSVYRWIEACFFLTRRSDLLHYIFTFKHYETKNGGGGLCVAFVKNCLESDETVSPMK
jgi:hypothetical protein